MKIPRIKKIFIIAITPVLFAGSLFAIDPFNGTANVTLTGDETLEFSSGTIELDADRTISLTGTAKNATIKIGATLAAGSVTVKPKTTGSPDAQLLFDVVDIGSTLTVEVLNDLLFTGNETSGKEMFLSFRGNGTVRFKIPSGRTISFGPDTTKGTRVRVLMDHKKGQADTNAQVVFEKWSYDTDSTNTDLTKHSYIKVGQYSSFEFVSQHASGLADPAIEYGYGVVEFDPSSASTGRLILELAKGDVDGDFKDAAFDIYGSRITGTGVSETDVQAVDFRTGVNQKYRAGIEAKVRIVNKVAKAHFDAISGTAWATHASDTDNSLGLAVINHNHSYPRLANNYDGRTVSASSEPASGIGLKDSPWYLANTVQTGFVLGNNGTIDIKHGRFFDYFAGATNAGTDKFPVAGTHVITGATTDSTDTHHTSKIKKHNPAALIVDGNAFRATGTTISFDATYAYDSNDIAHIKFEGNAGMYLRVAASSDTDALMNFGINADGTTGATATYIDGSIGKGTYDGKVINVMDGSSVSADQSSNLDGEVVLDVEGALRVVSYEATTESHAPVGFINLPTVLLDHNGKELKFASSTLSAAGARPLSMALTDEYYRYNTSSVLVNDQIELEYIRWVHNDLSRDLSGLPDAAAKPAIFGGELPSLKIAQTLTADPTTPFLDHTGSPIFLDNSTIECHESLVSAGVRWVVRDGLIDLTTDPAGVLTDADNSSAITLYNKGDDYDLAVTARGRVFQLGSRSNVMADGSTNDPTIFSDGSRPSSSLRDAFVDVYRQEPIPSSLVSVGDETNTMKLTINSAQETGVGATEKAIHFLHLTDRSQVNLGWSAGQFDDSGTVKIEVDSRYRPWEYTAAVLSFVQGLDPTNTGGYRFNPHTQGLGELVLAADNLYVSAGGRYDSVGVLSPASNELSPRNVSDGGGILYVDHGASLQTSGSYDVLIDTIIAQRTSAVAAGRGSLTVASDQILLQNNGKIITYGYDAVVDPLPAPTPGNLPVNLFHVPDIPVPSGFTPSKGSSMLTRSMFDPQRGFTFRSTDSVSAPVTMPATGLIVMGTGDSLEQAQVSGATRANPFHLKLTGDADGFARVREFVDITSDPAVLGEGAHAALFLDGGARIGLGSRRWNSHSARAWNQLGQDKVSLFMNGNGVVDLNDDLIIVDKLPIVATENFGQGASAHQLLFTSQVPREIRILSGGELDLSSFGRSGAAEQQIVFGGKVRLVLEAGAKIRFPSTVTSGNPANGPILYFNDDSRFILLGNEDRDEGRWIDSLTGSDKVRCKLMGIGQIWLNKRARMEIFDEALVGVEADTTTPFTDLTISIRRNSGMYIGDDTRAGGAFQIGNVVDGGGDGLNTGDGSTATRISLKVLINGENAQCNIGREGFFGVGAGTVNKINNPNGTLPSAATDPETDPGGTQYTAWRLHSLHNVKDFTINVQRGFFNHNQIFDGSDADSDGSLFAIGTLDFNNAESTGGTYNVTLGHPDKAFIRGGGNVMVIDAGVPHTAPKAVSVWDVVAALTGTGDTGKYSIMAPGNMMRTYITNPTGDAATFAVTTDANGVVTAYSMTSRAVSDVDSQGGAYVEMYNNISVPTYSTHPQKNLPAGASQDGVKSAHLAVVGSEKKISREVRTRAKDAEGNNASTTDALQTGEFDGVGVSNGGPSSVIAKKKI